MSIDTPVVLVARFGITRMKGHTMRIFIVSLLLVLLATISRAETPDDRDPRDLYGFWAEAPDHLGPRDVYELWTNCEPPNTFVWLNKHDATYLDLTEEAIEIAVRSRLRSARIYMVGSTLAKLEVTVHVVSNAFHIDVALRKSLEDQLFSGISGFATTWQTNSTGTHGNNAYFILQVVSQHMDKFLDEYLRVNADAC